MTDPFRPGARQWLELRDDEVLPQVLEAVKPSLVVWSSLWPDRPDDRVRFDIEPAGSECVLTWTLLTRSQPPDEDRVKALRYRLNVLINEKLRYSFGQ